MKELFLECRPRTKLITYSLSKDLEDGPDLEIDNEVISNEKRSESLNGHDAIRHERDHKIPNIPISKINVTHASKRRIELSNNNEETKPGKLQVLNRLFLWNLLYVTDD